MGVTELRRLRQRKKIKRLKRLVALMLYVGISDSRHLTCQR